MMGEEGVRKIWWDGRVLWRDGAGWWGVRKIGRDDDDDDGMVVCKEEIRGW